MLSIDHSPSASNFGKRDRLIHAPGNAYAVRVNSRFVRVNVEADYRLLRLHGYAGQVFYNSLNAPQPLITEIGQLDAVEVSQAGHHGVQSGIPGTFTYSVHGTGEDIE